MDKIKVLIAEDIDLIRENFKNLVNGQDDMAVMGTALNGSEIIELAAREACDIILMDIEMSNIHDGIHAAKAILDRQSDIHIIFLTVHEDEENIFSAFEAGAVDYVVKSSSDAVILKSIRDAYEGRSIIQPGIADKIRFEFKRMKTNEESLLFIINIISKLTPTEMEIVRMLLLDMKVSEIAKARSVEKMTIKTQISQLLRKFEKRRTKEIVYLIRQLKVGYLFDKR